MPKAAVSALVWSSEREIYELRGAGNAGSVAVEDDGELASLVEGASFAFHGQWGHLTLRREMRRQGSEGYWYAYRYAAHRTLKRYAGRTADLSIARLEEIAAELNAAPGSASIQPTKPMMSATLATEAGSQRQDARALASPVARLSSSESQAGLQVPLLASRLSLPRLSTRLIARTTLLARLDAGLERRLTLLCAPAGFGKTTLAGQWIAHLSTMEELRPTVAWLSLDDGDNDPARFWRYVFAACRRLDDGSGRSPLAQVYFQPSEMIPLDQVSSEISLTLLLNALSLLPTQGVLVLEDYHVIRDPRIHTSLAFLLDHLPATFHLVIITRTACPLPLARWRAGGELNEFGADDLRLSREETRAFLLQALAISPSPEVVNHLDALIGGWVTGLRLLTMALQGQGDESALEQRLASFSGSQRHVRDYFVGEVLAKQPEEIQSFLLQTCMLNDLTASLCAAVTGRADSEQILDDLELAQLFLIPLAGHERWYRYHPLFAEALRHEAQRRLGDETRRSGFVRASVWYEQQGQPGEAIEAALAAQAFERAAGLIEQTSSPQRFHKMHEHDTLERWLLALPTAVIQHHPVLCLTLAMTLLFTSDCRKTLTAAILARVERPLHMAEEVWRAEENRSGLGEALAFRTVIARFQGDQARALHLARQALDWLPEDARQWRATCLSTLGADELSAGELETARRTFLDAHMGFRAVSNYYGCCVTLLVLAEISVLQGRLHEGAALYQEVLELASEDLSDRSQALVGLARLAYEWNDLETAEARAQESLDLSTRLQDEALQIQALLVLAQIQHARGQTSQAFQQFAVLLARAQTQPSPVLYREIFVCQARLQLGAGELAQAQRWLTWQAAYEGDLPLLQRERERLLVARLLTVQGETDAALDLLAAVRAAAQRQGRVRDEIVALQLSALALHRQQSLDRAAQALCEALTLAHGEGYLRLFLDEGAPLAALLHALLPLSQPGSHASYLRTLLLAFSRPESSDPLAVQAIEPLSPQEQRVLRLLVTGLSNEEIAQTLVVSTNTVKTQLQSIYRKLNVHSRREARQAIHERN